MNIIAIIPTKKTYFLTFIAGITICSNILFNYVLIKYKGAIGAAWAVCLAFLIRFILTWFFAQKAYPMPWFSFAKTRRS